MRYVVSKEGTYLYLKVARRGWTVRREWVDLQEASTWAKPGHAKQASNLVGGAGLNVVISEVRVVVTDEVDRHRARKPR